MLWKVNIVLFIQQSGKKIRGTILMHQTTVHVYKNASGLPRDEQNIEVRIDEKVSNGGRYT